MAAKKTLAAQTGRDAAAPAKPAAARKTSAEKSSTANPAAEKAAAKKPTGGRAGAAPSAGKAAKPRQPKLAVRSGEKPWTAREVADVKATLESDAARLETEITAAEEEIATLMREGGEGAGHDQADVGSNTFERDHEMTLARNARENLELVQQGLARIDAGTYGVCESCGEPIGKARLQAFPRATLCMECKQRQERR